MSPDPRPTAGAVLNAAEALRSRRNGTWSDAEVAALMQLVYDSGRTASLREDLAEIHCVWEDHAEPRRTYEQVVARRLAEMAESARRARLAPARPTRQLDCEWPSVPEPGTVTAAQIEHLRGALAPCPCKRLPDGRHRVPEPFPQPISLDSYRNRRAA